MENVRNFLDIKKRAKNFELNEKYANIVYIVVFLFIKLWD